MPPGYPPLRGEDILRHLYKLDPAVAEEFKRQKADLDAEYTTVRQMAAKLAAERKRIRAEYPAPRDPIVGDEEQQPRSDIRACAGAPAPSVGRHRGACAPLTDASAAAAANHTVSVGETLLTVSRKYGLTVEEVYVPNMDRIDASGLQPNTVLQLPAQRAPFASPAAAATTGAHPAPVRRQPRQDGSVHVPPGVPKRAAGPIRQGPALPQGPLRHGAPLCPHYVESDAHMPMLARPQSKERDEYREVSEATNAAKEDDAKAEASVEKMQKMIAELKAAKNCA